MKTFYFYQWLRLLALTTTMHLEFQYAAGPESFEYHFQKGALVGQKETLNLWYVDTRPNSQKLSRSIWRSVLFGLFKKLRLVIFFFVVGKKVNIHFWKETIELCE